MKRFSLLTLSLILARTVHAEASFSGDLAATTAAPPTRLDDYLVETNPATFDKKAPAVTQQVLAADLKALNLTTTVGALRNLPNIFIRERFIGDKNAPVGIRGTSNRQTGRTVVLADGLLLSNFLGTGFGNSPRWFLVAPEEIEKVAVIYGPFSALYAGNSIGGSVLITTKMPSEFTASATGQYFYHNFREYGTDDHLHGSTGFVSIGDRVGKFSYYAFVNHLDNQSASTQFWTVNTSATAAPATGGLLATGARTDVDFSNEPRIIYGAEGPTKAVHDLFKAKLGYEFSEHTTLRYTFAYWTNVEDRERPETYLRDATGAEVWAGKIETAGRTFTILPAQFGLGQRRQADVINAFVLAHDADEGLQFTLAGSLYDVLRDKSYAATAALPAARFGGAGLGTIVGRTGWQSLDAKLGYRAASGPLSDHAPALGYHFDRYFTDSSQYVMSNWLDHGARTALNNGNGGKTRTHAFYAQDIWTFAPGWQLTPGLRWESWRAYDGARAKDFTTAGVTTRVTTAYAERTQSALSPKVAIAWQPAKGWNARFSLAEAYRFPTIGELFQGSIGATGSITNSDPNLRPERDLAKDLTIERTLAAGLLRLSFFEEDVRRAILNQTTLLANGTSLSGNTNVGKILTRGAELSFDRKKFLFDSLDTYVAVSFTSAKIIKNPGLAASEGKQVPRIPYWQTRAGLTWRTTPWLSLNAQLRTSSHQFNTLDNTDPLGGYGGTDDYLVIDTKATATLHKNLTASLGVDNVGDFRYHVFHPMPERTFFTELNWRY